MLKASDSGKLMRLIWNCRRTGAGAVGWPYIEGTAGAMSLHILRDKKIIEYLDSCKGAQQLWNLFDSDFKATWLLMATYKPVVLPKQCRPDGNCALNVVDETKGRVRVKLQMQLTIQLRPDVGSASGVDYSRPKHSLHIIFARKACPRVTRGCSEP